MRIFICVSFILIGSCSANAQKITGHITDTRQQPVLGATVLLQLTSDSFLVKINTSDINGRYIFSLVSPSQYFIAISNAGFNTSSSEIILIEGNDAIVPAIAIEKIRTGWMKLW